MSLPSGVQTAFGLGCAFVVGLLGIVDPLQDQLIVGIASIMTLLRFQPELAAGRGCRSLGWKLPAYVALNIALVSVFAILGLFFVGGTR